MLRIWPLAIHEFNINAIFSKHLHTWQLKANIFCLRKIEHIVCCNNQSRFQHLWKSKIQRFLQEQNVYSTPDIKVNLIAINCVFIILSYQILHSYQSIFVSHLANEVRIFCDDCPRQSLIFTTCAVTAINLQAHI